MSRESIEAWVKKLSEWEKKQPLLILNTKAYSPVRVLKEVRMGTELGKKLQEKYELGRVALTDEATVRELAKRRLIKLHKERPVEMYTLLIDKPRMTSEEIIRDIEIEGDVGKALIETEIEHMRDLMVV